MKPHINVNDKLALPPNNEQTIIIIEDQQSPSSQASECNVSTVSCTQKCISTTKNQHLFNLISPSSIPNPNPSVSTKPLTLLQDSFATYNPYVSPITGHVSYSTPHFLPDVKDFQNLLSIPISIQDNQTNTFSQNKNLNQNAEKKSENSSSSKLERSFYNSEQSIPISLLQNDREVHNFQNGTFQDCIQDQCVNDDDQSNKNYGTKLTEQQNSKFALTKNISTSNEKCNVKSSVEITNLDFRSTVPNNDIFLSKTLSNNYRSANNNISSVKIIHSENYDMNDPNFAQTLESSSQEQNKYATQKKINMSQQMFISKNSISDANDKSSTFNIKDIEQKTDKTFKTNMDSSNIVWNFHNKSNDISILEKSVLENLEQKNWNTPFILKPNAASAVTNKIKNMETGDNDSSNKCTFIPSITNDKVLLTFPQKLQNLNNTILLTKSKEDISNTNDAQIYSKKLKEHLLSENVNENHVVALKRLHQENIDENDFENLITENQIYGNKIVIKEKSQFVVSNEKNSNNFKANSKNSIISDYKMNSDFGFQSNFSNINNVLQNHAKLPNILDEKSSVIQRLKDNIFGNHANDNILNPIFQTNNTNHVHLSDQSFKTINPFTQSLSYVKTNIVETPTSNNVLQTLLNKPTIKLHEQIAVNHNLQTKNHMLYQMPYLIEGDESANMFSEKPHSNSEFAMLLSKVNDEWKTINTNQNLKINENLKLSTHNNIIHKSEDTVLSSIDLAEKRRRKRLENKRSSVSKTEKQRQQKVPKTNTEDMHEFRLSFKQYQMYVGIVGEKYFDDSTSEDSTSSESEEEDTSDDIHHLTLDISTPPNYDHNKLDFLNVFGLTTIAKRNERELEKVEKSIKLDAITTALVSVTESIQAISQSEKVFSLDVPKETLDIKNSNKTDEQIMFLNSLRLGSVTETYKIEHESMWQYILKERKRRNGISPLLHYFEKLSETQNNFKTHSTSKNETINIHTKDQLETMTEIKKSVTENNNLIKKAIDNILTPGKNDSNEHLIPELAEKNFSQITKLSNMANKSLKMFGKQHYGNNEQSEAIMSLHEKVNDLNAKFDNNNTRSQVTPKLNIPNVPKVISLKTLQDSNVMDISPATSMDEPRSSAAGAFDGDDTNNPIVIMYASANEANSNVDIKQNIHTEKEYKWPGIEVIIEAYRKYNEDSKVERNALIHENTRLLREVMSLQTEATNLTNEMQQLLSKQQTYEEQQVNIQTSLDIIHNCIKQLVV